MDTTHTINKNVRNLALCRLAPQNYLNRGSLAKLKMAQKNSRDFWVSFVKHFQNGSHKIVETSGCVFLTKMSKMTPTKTVETSGGGGLLSEMLKNGWATFVKNVWGAIFYSMLAIRIRLSQQSYFENISHIARKCWIILITHFVLTVRVNDTNATLIRHTLPKKTRILH